MDRLSSTGPCQRHDEMGIGKVQQMPLGTLFTEISQFLPAIANIDATAFKPPKHRNRIGHVEIFLSLRRSKLGVVQR